MFSYYLNIYIYFIICLLFVCFLFFLSFFLVVRVHEVDKLSIYECGFNPFGDARKRIEVRFFLVSLIFIIFDLELMFLFPFLLILSKLYFFTLVICLYFFVVLVIGFVFELSNGSLD